MYVWKRLAETQMKRVCLMFGFSGVKLGQGALRDPLQHLFGEDPHQLPADVQSLEHAPVLVGTWTHGHVGDQEYITELSLSHPVNHI